MKLGELDIGDRIVFGSYSGPIKWIKVSDSMYIAEEIQEFLPFDAPEANNPNRNQRAHGNSRYSQSNIDSFLNSREENWFTPRHEYDSISDDILGVFGFLTRFKEWEINAIIDSDIECFFFDENEGTIAEHIIRKVFVPSALDVTGLPPTGSPYWLREPRGFDIVSFRNTHGSLSEAEADWWDMGVRPALNINPELLVYDDIDNEGYYEVIQPGVGNIEDSMEDFFTLIESSK